MAFNDVEISEFGNQPIELYTFTRGTVSWRYVSSLENQFSFGGNSYTPVPIRRSAIEASQDIGKSNIKITIDRRIPFLQQYISESPTEVVSVVIERTHSSETDSAIIWRGRLTNVKFSENNAELTSEPIFTAMRRPVLRRLYQLNCPHVLYGPVCKVVRSTFMVNATISGISGNVITSPTFSVSINPTFDASWFVGGYVDFVQSGLTSRRFITNHDNGAGSVTLDRPFVGLANGDAVMAYPGCDRTTATCSGKFTNIENFGGFPYIPQKNPMDGTPVF